MYTLIIIIIIYRLSFSLSFFFIKYPKFIHIVIPFLRLRFFFVSIEENFFLTNVTRVLPQSRVLFTIEVWLWKEHLVTSLVNNFLFHHLSSTKLDYTIFTTFDCDVLKQLFIFLWLFIFRDFMVAQIMLGLEEIPACLWFWSSHTIGGFRKIWTASKQQVVSNTHFLMWKYYIFGGFDIIYWEIKTNRKNVFCSFSFFERSNPRVEFERSVKSTR